MGPDGASSTGTLPSSPAAVAQAGRGPGDGRLRVALMGRSLRGQYSGVVRYTDELARALAPRLGRDLAVFVTRGRDGLQGLALRRIQAPFSTPNEYARAFWEQVIVPPAVARLALDVSHSPNYILPAAIRCPSVVTIHDVAFLDRAVHRLRSHLYLTALTLLALRKAVRVVCVSEYTAGRLVERFPWVRAKTRVIGEGLSERFAPQPAAAVDAFRARHDLDRPYALFVGTIEPRKNVPRLLRAFERAAVRGRLPHQLVLVGASGWKTGPVWTAYQQSRMRERIRFLGYVGDEDLPAAYAGADLFVYPSLHEGFGLPPLEAMACGSPVLTSNSSALAEVSGPAAATVNPEDEDALAEEIERLLSDPDRRRELAATGSRHVRRFRWPEVAEQFVALYREVSA